MNVIELIKSDHEEVEKMFKQIEKFLKNEDEEKIIPVFQELKNSLLLHAKSEAISVYERLLEDEKVKNFAFEGEEEHGLVEELLAKLDGESSIDDRWEGTFTVLKELVEHHVEEEEDELMPKMKKVFSKAELEEMGEDMIRQKQSLANSPEFMESIDSTDPSVRKGPSPQSERRMQA